MKRIFWIFSFLLLSLMNLPAQNALLDRIEQKGNSFHTLKADFRQVKTIAANGREIASEGILYYAPEKFSMHYSQEYDDLLVINGKDFFMKKGKKKNLFNTETNKVMRSLSNTLLYCMVGKVQLLAEENDADLSVQDGSPLCQVTLTARKKAAKGYSTILLDYDKESGLLMKMVMNEFNGNSTVYVMSGYQKNGALSEELFQIPR